MLPQVFPQYKWETTLFSQLESDIWTNERLANSFVEWLKKQPENEISQVAKVVKNKKQKNVLLPQLLQSAFPKYSWINTVGIPGKRTQYILKQYLDILFPGNQNSEMLEEYKHPEMNLELDYFFPQYKLAFEYQVLITFEIPLIL